MDSTTGADRYAVGRAGSARLFAEAVQVFPSGVTHDGRYMTPFPIYIRGAEGGHKWDVDGNEYIDFVMGHGSLLLGHSHPAVVEAVITQMSKGTHMGGCTELELEWGKLVKRLVPCAERVKFTNSGTEATMLAMRLARAHTGREKIVKFQGHFHGWHDYATIAMAPPFEVPTSAGIPRSTAATVVALDQRDEAGLQSLLESDRDVAAVILEPSGASWGTVPLRPGYLQWLRDLTQRCGVVLIFDEVITGFRMAPGGAQQFYGVTPDLATLAKILAGGLPGAAVAGRAEIMERLTFKRGDGQWNRFRRINHQGTFNANPVSAAAGIAALNIVATGKPQARAADTAAALREGMNGVLARRGTPGCIYGELSMFHIYLGDCPRAGDCDRSLCTNDPVALKGARSGARTEPLRRSMLTLGLDTMGAGGWVSSAHTEEDVERTVEIFESALGEMD